MNNIIVTDKKGNYRIIDADKIDIRKATVRIKKKKSPAKTRSKKYREKANLWIAGILFTASAIILGKLAIEVIIKMLVAAWFPS